MPDRFTFTVALLALLLAGLALWRTFQPVDVSENLEAEHGSEHDEEHGSVAPYMADLQRYAEKLYHAGQNEHWELASFYGHELEEAAEAIEQGGFEEDGQPLAPLVARWLMPSVEQAEAAAEAGDRRAFDTAYAELVTACNTCHAATDHGFIAITAPEANAFTNQDFAP